MLLATGWHRTQLCRSICLFGVLQSPAPPYFLHTCLWLSILSANSFFQCPVCQVMHQWQIMPDLQAPGSLHTSTGIWYKACPRKAGRQSSSPSVHAPLQTWHKSRFVSLQSHLWLSAATAWTCCTTLKCTQAHKSVCCVYVRKCVQWVHQQTICATFSACAGGWALGQETQGCVWTPRWQEGSCVCG